MLCLQMLLKKIDHNLTKGSIGLFCGNTRGLGERLHTKAVPFITIGIPKQGAPEIKCDCANRHCVQPPWFSPTAAPCPPFNKEAS